MGKEPMGQWSRESLPKRKPEQEPGQNGTETATQNGKYKNDKNRLVNMLEIALGMEMGGAHGYENADNTIVKGDRRVMLLMTFEKNPTTMAGIVPPSMATRMLPTQSK